MKVLICTMAYNAEKTISRAIDSIRNQTFPHWEYFILDNGSTDRTWEILNEYARRDRRVMPMRIEKNDPAHGGLFLRALPLVSDAGYFVWLDADDAYSPDFLEKMVSFAEENRLDIAACGHDRMDGLSGRLLKRRVSPENLVLHGAEFEKRFVDYRAFLTTVWGKLYSVPFFKKALGAEMAPHRAVFVMYGDSIFCAGSIPEGGARGRLWRGHVSILSISPFPLKRQSPGPRYRKPAVFSVHQGIPGALRPHLPAERGLFVRDLSLAGG